MSSLCAKCAKPLVVEVHDDDDDGDADEDLEVLSDAEGDIPMSTDDDGDGDGDEGATATVPDDVQLSCGHHFHWECLLESYEIETCPKCGRNITTPAAAAAVAGSSSSATTTTTGTSSDPQILVNLHNEGGFQSQIDIFPILQEESYLHAYPEERKSRAFLEFCKQGDHRAIAELIKSCNNNNNNNPEEQQEENTSPPASHILRYQDPLNGMQSGLHAAVAHGHREVAWLLLLLASELPELEFPAVVYQEAATLEVMRGDQSGMVDIRSLKDARGRTAEDLARELAGAAGGWGVWNGWIGNGRLAMLP